MAAEIHEGDIGTVFEAELIEDTLPLDVSSATTKQLKFQKADGTVVVKDADFVTDGTDGKLQYVTEDATFLVPHGYWQWQPFLEIAGWSGHGDIAGFPVYENLS